MGQSAYRVAAELSTMYGHAGPSAVATVCLWALDRLGPQDLGFVALAVILISRAPRQAS